jgi:DNA repair exonuclease SbcCD ATPase subunit
MNMIPVPKLMLLSLAVLCCAQAVAAEKVYKWRNEEGTVIFSDTPPPGREVEEINLPELSGTTLETPPQERRQLLRKSDQIGEAIELRQETRQALQQELEQTREKLEQARRALEQGKEPKPDERRGLVGGGTRLLPSYFNRIERQKQEIQRLEQRIAELEQQLGSLR